VTITHGFGTFASRLVKYEKEMTASQVAAFQRSVIRIDTAHERAKRELTPSGRISRLGGAAGPGRRKGGTLTVRKITRGPTFVQWQPNGAWAILDSGAKNVTRTAGHTIAPDPRRNRRPLPPATKYQPSLLMRSTGDEPMGREGFRRPSVFHPGSTRKDAWRRHVQGAYPRIVDEQRQVFFRSLKRS
jgi:hypothetical protein